MLNANSFPNDFPRTHAQMAGTRPTLCGYDDDGIDYPRATDNPAEWALGHPPSTEAFWEPYFGPDAELEDDLDGRAAARRAYARTVLRACRSFARDAPTRGLTQRHHTENVSNADYVRAAGLPTMRPVQIKRYARSLAPI